MEPGRLKVGIVKSNFKETIEMFVVQVSTFSFMNSIKETQAYWKLFI